MDNEYEYKSDFEQVSLRCGVSKKISKERLKLAKKKIYIFGIS